MSGESRTSCSYDWEAAYLRFETPNQARAKILGRLKRFGAATWSPDAGILEIFCGSGAGLEALTELGFGNLDGMDLSGDLLARYDGPARTHVADCRSLPFETASRDVVIVHGGLHHLESHDDVRAVLDEVHRVLVPGGRFCAVADAVPPVRPGRFREPDREKMLGPTRCVPDHGRPRARHVRTLA